MSGTDDAIPTLVEWAGGPPAMARLIDAFYDRVERDDLLSPFFPGGVTVAHRRHVALWWTEVFGGPSDYTDRLGGYDRMLAHHRGLSITADQRLRFATTMSQAADDAGLPADPEFRAALRAYMEWAVDDVLVYSGEDAVVPGGLPMPRWSWDGLETGPRVTRRPGFPS
jgi:hemoglobin